MTTLLRTCWWFVEWIRKYLLCFVSFHFISLSLFIEHSTFLLSRFTVNRKEQQNCIDKTKKSKQKKNTSSIFFLFEHFFSSKLSDEFFLICVWCCIAHNWHHTFCHSLHYMHLSILPLILSTRFSFRLKWYCSSHRLLCFCSLILFLFFFSSFFEQKW